MEKLKELILRKKHVATEEEELEHAQAQIARNIWKQYRLFPPSSPLRNQWNSLMMWLVLYNCLQIPLSLAFTFEPGTQKGLDYFDVIVDSCFGVDILLNFRTTFYVDEELVYDNNKITMRYAWGWFPLDFLATFPWQAVGNLGYLKLIKVARLSRLAKGGTHRGASSARILKLGLGWMLVAHWIACIWWAIGMYEWNKQKYSLEPLAHSSWMIRVGPTGRAISADNKFGAAQFSQCVELCRHALQGIVELVSRAHAVQQRSCFEGEDSRLGCMCCCVPHLCLRPLPHCLQPLFFPPVSSLALLSRYLIHDLQADNRLRSDKGGDVCASFVAIQFNRKTTGMPQWPTFPRVWARWQPND